jgi:hypothetical protein
MSRRFLIHPQDLLPTLAAAAASSSNRPYEIEFAATMEKPSRTLIENSKEQLLFKKDTSTTGESKACVIFDVPSYVY